MFRLITAVLLGALTVVAFAAPAIASPCFALAGFPSLPGATGLRIVPASLEDSRATFTYLTHSTYLIESPAGVRAVTDYSGYLGEGPTPDIATMNFAHSTHWTSTPDPAIRHVLKGWDPVNGAEHYLKVGDIVVRNVTTDIRSWEESHIVENGNSIFIFEIGDLCIGHLGHLHHEPTDEQYALIGRLDVVMAPVDGGYTLSLPAMIRVLKRLRASVVLPMHWFGSGNLQIFLSGMAGDFAIARFPGPSLTVSAADLPGAPTVFVPPGY